MILRKMIVEDVPQVRCIEVATSETPWSYQTFVDCVEVGYECWVFEEDNILIAGFGLLSFGAGEAHILNVAMDINWQGQGYGRKMMNHLMKFAQDKGSKSVYLEVRETNTVAISLYEKLDFKEIGRRVDYYGNKSGNREDALVLEVKFLKE
ncbi:MAG: ribosomal protein S18-alanine N-acetyltransferase [Francisellaceae bacterium]|jgi:[ribosomal protein S18]-alanine N-acetyltransferase|nr:ribosomal protein S18-alanine N-acetyltransferase [Francisellaceae bacterium]MBT6206638.1 ribosomal protein S18-alanine N-acetyltransferase [Francisellaceae bacterium]MBT6539465.1 ribosomal protein S18-alanine N-acetyltransferase [Francisellaceae bacterium]